MRYVYVVTVRRGGDYRRVDAVFSNDEAAREYLKKRQSDDPDDDYYQVETFALDETPSMRRARIDNAWGVLACKTEQSRESYRRDYEAARQRLIDSGMVAESELSETKWRIKYDL